MTYPDDRSMTSLAALCEATDAAIWDDARILITTPRGNWELLPWEVDDLTARGWISHEYETLHVTESGFYWSKKYQGEKAKKIKVAPNTPSLLGAMYRAIKGGGDV